jgi:Protein of unknown function (DUF464).
MITVTIHRNQKGFIQSFTIKGHANFARRGSDIVCAGVSAVTFGTINAVEALTGIVPDVDQGSEGGYLHCRIPEGLPAETEEKVRLLLEGMLVSLKTIERDYHEYITITFKP